MTPEELKDLSRRAAECLPKEFRRQRGIDAHDGLHSKSGCIHINTWLHESTEACTEIMVRVLWPARVDICGDGRYTADARTWIPHGAWIWPAEGSGISVVDSDPMLAFRVAVLKALIALKGK